MTWIEAGVIAYRTVFSYFFLLAILKIMGKREIGNLSTFDIVVFFIISELFSLSLNNLDNSLWHSILPITIIVVLQIVTALISLKSRKIRKIAEGNRRYIIKQGKIDIEAMKKERYSIDDLMYQLLQNNVLSPKDVDYAILEDTGKLSIIQKKDNTLNYVEPLIIDGKLNYEFMKKNNIDASYIQKQISKQGYEDISQIFFAQDLKDEFYIVPFEKSSNK